MRIQQIVETTTAGSVATVAQPLMTQTREDTNVRGLKPVQQVMKGAKKKGPYANSIVEGKVKELAKDLKDLTSHQFQEKYKQSKAEIRADMKKVNEDDLSEQDLIVIPGQGRLKRTGFVKHDLDQGEHEGHTLKNSLHTIARAASELDKRLSVQSEFPEWVSEKIGAAKGMMVSVMDYLISSQEMQHDPDAMNEGSQRVDSIVTDALRVMKGPEVSDAVLALKRVLGDRAYNERRGFYSFYVDQIVDMYGQQGVAEGEIDTSRMNQQHQDFYNKNPNFKRDDREATSVGGRLATKVTPKTAQVTKKPMTPFEGKIDFAKKLQGKVDKHNKAVVQTRQAVGSRVADIGAGGKEYNVKTDAAWDAAKKKVSEGAKVDRMVKHIEKSEEKAGKSKKDAENIAWATANKRGMLDNKNKKK